MVDRCRGWVPRVRFGALPEFPLSSLLWSKERARRCSSSDSSPRLLSLLPNSLLRCWFLSRLHRRLLIRFNVFISAWGNMFACVVSDFLTHVSLSLWCLIAAYGASGDPDTGAESAADNEPPKSRVRAKKRAGTPGSPTIR